MVVHTQNEYDIADETLYSKVIQENPTIDAECANYFSFYLKNMRTFFKLTKAEFSKCIGVNSRTYYNYEKGLSLPEDPQAIRSSISRMLENKRCGLPLTSHLNSIDPKLLHKVISLHNEGKNTVQIGIRLSLDQDDVYTVLSDAGYEPILYHYSI